MCTIADWQMCRVQGAIIVRIDNMDINKYQTLKNSGSWSFYHLYQTELKRS